MILFMTSLFVSLDFTDSGNCLTKTDSLGFRPLVRKSSGIYVSVTEKHFTYNAFYQIIQMTGSAGFGYALTTATKNSSTFLPEETDNQLFTHANGYTLYTDDGYEYALEPCKELPCSEGGSTQTSDIKDEPYLSSQDLQVPVPDFLTDEQKLLYLRAYKMMLIRIGTYAIDDTQYFPCDNPDTTRTYTDTISVDGYEYTLH